MKRYTVNVENLTRSQKKLVIDALYKIFPDVCKDFHDKYLFIDGGNIEMTCRTYIGDSKNGLLWHNEPLTPTHTFIEILQEAGISYTIDLDEEADIKFTWRELVNLFGIYRPVTNCGRDDLILAGEITNKIGDVLMNKSGSVINKFSEIPIPFTEVEQGTVTNYWIDALFKVPEKQESEKEKKVRELREQAEKILEQALELENNL